VVQEVADKFIFAMVIQLIRCMAICRNITRYDENARNHQGMLVATDVAARGIDVDDVTHVINYNFIG